MEAASEKRRRGRPQKFDAEHYQAAAAEGPETRRGQQDHIYARVAIIFLKKRFPDPEDERRSWLFSEERTPKWTLLAEMGRVLSQHGEEVFWQVVEAVLERRPKVKDAVRRIRTARTAVRGD